MRPASPLAALLSLLALGWSGCAPPLSLARPATVIEPGHVRVGADLGIRVAPGAQDLQEQARRDHIDHVGERCGTGDPEAVCVDDDAWRSFLQGAAAGLMSSPQSADAGLAVRYGVRPGMDAGVRLSPATARGEVAWQVVGDPLNSVDSGATALVGVGLSHQFDFGRQPLQLLELTERGRNDLDLFALLGYRYWRRGYLSVGGRYMATLLRAGLRSADDAAPADSDISGLGHHVGFVASAYAGFGAAFLGLELVGGLDLTRIRGAGQDVWLTSTSYRPGLVFFLEI